MKILPSMCRGFVFVHEDGKTFELAPLQVFIGNSGQTVIRIGRNVLYFNKDGTFDGTESHVDNLDPGSPETEVIHEAFELQGKMKGLCPERPYFQPGSPGYAAETRMWAQGRVEDAGEVYTAKVRGPRTH